MISIDVAIRATQEMASDAEMKQYYAHVERCMMWDDDPDFVDLSLEEFHPTLTSDYLQKEHEREQVISLIADESAVRIRDLLLNDVDDPFQEIGGAADLRDAVLNTEHAGIDKITETLFMTVNTIRHSPPKLRSAAYFFKVQETSKLNAYQQEFLRETIMEYVSIIWPLKGSAS